jgi:hypothetical protein
MVALAQPLDFHYKTKVAIGFLNVAKLFSPYLWVSSHTDSIRGSLASCPYM